MSPETDDSVSHFLYHHGLYVAIALAVFALSFSGFDALLWATLAWLVGLLTGGAVIGWRSYHEEGRCQD